MTGGGAECGPRRLICNRERQRIAVGIGGRRLERVERSRLDRGARSPCYLWRRVGGWSGRDRRDGDCERRQRDTRCAVTNADDDV
jgi:hypothetical protein